MSCPLAQGQSTAAAMMPTEAVAQLAQPESVPDHRRDTTDSLLYTYLAAASITSTQVELGVVVGLDHVGVLKRCMQHHLPLDAVLLQVCVTDHLDCHHLALPLAWGRHDTSEGDVSRLG
jgi:hypothetical protein